MNTLIKLNLIFIFLTAIILIVYTMSAPTKIIYNPYVDGQITSNRTVRETSQFVWMFFLSITAVVFFYIKTMERRIKIFFLLVTNIIYISILIMTGDYIDANRMITYQRIF